MTSLDDFEPIRTSQGEACGVTCFQALAAGWIWDELQLLIHLLCQRGKGLKKFVNGRKSGGSVQSWRDSCGERHWGAVGTVHESWDMMQWWEKILANQGPGFSQAVKLWHKIGKHREPPDILLLRSYSDTGTRCAKLLQRIDCMAWPGNDEPLVKRLRVQL